MTPLENNEHGQEDDGNWIEVTLQRGPLPDAAAVTVRMDDHVVTVTEPGGQPTRAEYTRIEQAWCVFEANVCAFEADGLTVTRETCSAGRPGVLADFAEGRTDELYWRRYGGEGLWAVGVDAADSVALWDGTRRELGRAQALARFDRSTLDPVWEVEHALRRVLAHPDSALLATFALALAFEHDRLLDRIVEAGAGHLLTHLWLTRAFRDRPLARVRALGDELPNLRALTLERWSLPHFGARPLCHLEHLQLQEYWPEVGRMAPPALPLDSSLDAAAALAPSLRSLRLLEAGVRREALATLLAHPLVARLAYLDVVATSHRPDVALLLAQRERFAHLDALFVSDHVLAPGDREQLDALSVVVPVSHRRDHPSSPLKYRGRGSTRWIAPNSVGACRWDGEGRSNDRCS